MRTYLVILPTACLTGVATFFIAEYDTTVGSLVAVPLGIVSGLFALAVEARLNR